MLLQPRSVRKPIGLGSAPFARHYSGYRRFFLFLRVLRCFSSPGSPQFHNWYTVFNCVGCPIRIFADQFPGFAPSHDGTWPSAMWVAPFGHSRINSCLQIPATFRSLPRPSSPPDSLGILRSLFLSFLMALDEIAISTRNLKKKLLLVTPRPLSRPPQTFSFC